MKNPPKFREPQEDGLTSIVILSYNRPDNLPRNIESLYANTNKPFEVILFDNASPDQETQQLLSELEGKTKDDGNGLIKIIRNDENIGCSAGRQQALTYTRGEYIVTMDDDMTYSANWLDALHDRLNQDILIAAAMCKVVFPNGLIQVNGGGHIEQEHGRLVNFIPLDPYKSESDPQLSGEQDCDWIGGGATIIRRSVAGQVEHKSKEIYLNGYEDYDYSLQIRNLGYRIVNCPQSIVHHHHLGYDLKEFAELVKRNPAYVGARSNRETIITSLFRFFEQTGLCLIRDFKGNKLYQAKGHSLDGKNPEEIERLCLEELAGQHLSPTPFPSHLVKKGIEFHREQREKIRARYGLNKSKPSKAIKTNLKTNIRTILNTYQPALALNTDHIDMAQLTEIIHQSLSGWKKLLDDNSPEAGYFFNLEDGTLTADAVSDLIEKTAKTWIPINNNNEYNWAPKYILSFLLNTELKYCVALEPSRMKKAELKMSQSSYFNAAKELRMGNFIEALNLYGVVLRISPNSQSVREERDTTLDGLSQQLQRQLDILSDPQSLNNYMAVRTARQMLTRVLNSGYNSSEYLQQAEQTAQSLLSKNQYDLAEEVAIGITKAQPENKVMWNLIGEAVQKSQTAARPNRIRWAEECYRRGK